MSDPLLAPVAIVGEVVAGAAAKRAQAIRTQINGLNELVTSSTFDLAELLAEVKGAGYFGSWGYQTFPDYVELELGMKPRRAHYLVRIHNIMKQLNIPRSLYEMVSITKLREIVRLEPGDFYHNLETGENEPLAGHIVRLVESAQSLSMEQIVNEIKRLLNLVGDDELTWWNVSVKRIVRESVILPAMELARQRMGSAGKDNEGVAVEYSDGAVLEMICAEFLADPNNTVDENDMFLVDVLAQQDMESPDTSAETTI